MSEWESVEIGGFEIKPTDKILAAFYLNDRPPRRGRATNLFGVCIRRGRRVICRYRFKYWDGEKRWYTAEKTNGNWGDLIRAFISNGFCYGQAIFGIRDFDHLMSVVTSFPSRIDEVIFWKPEKASEN